MSHNKKTSLAIGAFILGAIVLVFIALLFFSGGRLFADKERVMMYFDGSVQGLQVGAPIKLKGVVLGEITDIQINFQNDNKSVVTAVTADLVMKRINAQGTTASGKFIPEAINNGLRAQLNFQSLLTGLLYVELDFYPNSEARTYNLQSSFPEIPTIATSFEEITKNFQEMNFKELAGNINKLVTQINGIVASGEIQTALNNFNKAAIAIDKTSTNLDKQAEELTAELKLTLNNANQFITQLNQNTPAIANSLNKSLASLDASLKRFEDATATINNSFSEDAPVINQLTSTLEDISRSAQAFRSLSETLEQQPEAILRGRHDGEKNND